jgi:hypothetical protein
MRNDLPSRNLTCSVIALLRSGLLAMTLGTHSCCKSCVYAHVCTGQGTATPADTHDGSEIRDSESEISGLSDMISNLHSLRRELDSEDISTTGTDTPTREQDTPTREQEEGTATGSGEGGQEGVSLETGELRRRTGK